MFEKIKNKLEEDHPLSNSGWSDEELMEKLLSNLTDDIKQNLNEDKIIEEIGELIGKELLEM